MSLVDDHSRVAYVEVLENETASACAMFPIRAVKGDRPHFFSIREVTIERVMIDNGVSYKACKFVATISQFDARHLRPKTYTSKTNGKAERLIKTLQEEWA